MSNLANIQLVINDLQVLHKGAGLTPQDRSQIMIADQLMRNLTPYREWRMKYLNELAEMGEDNA